MIHYLQSLSYTCTKNTSHYYNFKNLHQMQTDNKSYQQLCYIKRYILNTNTTSD